MKALLGQSPQAHLRGAVPLLPAEEDRNLILTGASLSFTYDTIFMVMRNFPWCTQTGEIAGYAAAQCVRKRISPKELEWTAPYF